MTGAKKKKEAHSAEFVPPDTCECCLLVAGEGKKIYLPKFSLLSYTIIWIWGKLHLQPAFQ